MNCHAGILAPQNRYYTFRFPSAFSAVDYFLNNKLNFRKNAAKARSGWRIFLLEPFFPEHSARAMAS